ncbi:MAG: endonuclease/exonuclease/phosphatase family protein [Elusimicrobia bacterium]|nr:endonuclease/exonuclease/phosphatase family protein [Elusimicrobiota bacterium]
MKVLQWNIGNFDVRPRLPGRGYRGMAYTFATASRDSDLESVAAVIRAEAPDAVTLQEVVVKQDHHRRLAELTGYSVAAAGTPEYRHTQVLLARPETVEVLEPLTPPGRINGVGAKLRLRDGKGEISVLSNHSDAGIQTQGRIAQHKRLAAWAAERRDGPLVIGGDFNFDDAPGSMHHAAERLRAWLPFVPKLATADWEADCEAIDALRGALRDLAKGAGPTSGAPRRWPRILLPLGAPLIPLGWALGVGRLRSRLDCIFASPPLSAGSARVLRLTGPSGSRHPSASPEAFDWMDHDPVVVDVSPPGS